MNIFRGAADFLHLLSIFILLFKIRKQKNCVGISLKTQELYVAVFATRYLLNLDLFLNFVSLYNTVMKVFFLSSSIYTVYLIRFKLKHTYDKEHDSFRVLFLVVPCVVLSLLINYEFTYYEILWTFSIYLESVAIFPQLFLLHRTGEVENLQADYIVCLGLYRALYIFNWVYRYFTEGYTDWIPWVSGAVQTALYCDFFYYYVISKYYGKKIQLP